MSIFQSNSGELASSPATTGSDAFVPQFSRPEYGQVQGASSKRCLICSDQISHQYFLIRKRTVCEVCAEKARAGMRTDSFGAFLRALVFGLGGAILGMILYSSFTMATGWSIGYLAFAIGFIVGKAAQKGSNGAGGFRIQCIAALLTYLAITFNALPELLVNAYAHPGSVTNWARTLEETVSTAIQAPFLRIEGDPLKAAIGLFVLFLGPFIASQLTQARTLSVDGPYSLRA